MSKLRLTIIALGLTVSIVIIIVLPGVSTAQPHLPPAAKMKARWWMGALPLVPFSRSPGDVPANGSSPSLSTSTGLADWSSIAFQSYRDGNWEIYLARGDGSQPVRLTHHSAADERPRLNRGATRLAFTSERDGNPEIYAMNADGSGLVRLTFHSASDIGAAWSPDGSQMVFASDRDGNMEVYAMNSDGSVQTRLTWDAADDIFPTWSPDGRQVAWVRRDGLDGAIWVMNADGTNPHPLTGMLRFLQHPMWSPDGTRLAFDYDVDGDFWNELAVINADGTGVQTVYDPSQDLVDAWLGSWSPDGEWLLFSRVEYVIHDDELYLWSTEIERIRIGNWWAESVIASGYDLLPDWQTMDASPPYARVHPLPPLSRAPGFSVQWSGTDVGLAELMNYDVQFRDEAEPWTDWFTEVATTSAVFAGEPGHTCAFRVRGRDHAYNVGSYRSGGDTQTTLFTWLLSGTVQDNRGVPVEGASLAIQPPPVKVSAPDPYGRYMAYLAATGEHTLDAARSGYGGLPTVTLDMDRDRYLSVYLPPPDDAIIDGGFETGGFAGWSVVGEDTQVTDLVSHSGQWSAQLGRPWELGEPMQISAQNARAVYPYAAAGADGTLHVVWSEGYYSDQAYYARKVLGGEWSVPEPIPNSPSRFSGPRLAVTDDGTAHVAWWDWEGGTDYLRYARRRPWGEWTSPEVVPGHIANGFFDLATDGHNTVHVIGCDGDELSYTSRQSDGVWSAPATISDGMDCWFKPTLAVGPDARLYVVWGGAGSGRDLYYNVKTGEGWMGARSTGLDADFPDIVVGPSGTMHLIALCDGFYPCYRSLMPNETWSAVENVDNRSARRPVLAVGTDGRVYAAWVWQTTYISTRLPNGQWTEREVLGFGGSSGGSATEYAAVVTWGDIPHYVWNEEMDTSSTMYYRSAVDLPSSSVSSMGQWLTLPPSLHKPTLSFVYQFHGESPGATNELAVVLSAADVVSETTVFSTTTATADWQQAWVDVGLWADQSIAVSFTVTADVGFPPAQATIDEVSLGSWLTPVIHEVWPSQVEAWVITPITVTGENFVVTPTVRLNEMALDDTQWIDEQNLRVILPADLRPGVYNVWVTNPGGQEAVLTGGLRIGWQIYLPTLLKGYVP